MKQTDALSILKTGQNVFLTGQAGAGKTYVLNAYIDYLHKFDIPVAITASTGIAATHLNGMTLHSWSGIGIKNSFAPEDFLKLSKKDAFTARLRATRVLIIDEISMLHKKQVDLVNKVLQHFLESDLPFGGLQVIFAGDFFQLPPIGEKGEQTKDKFAFMSDVWVDMVKNQKLRVCYLSEQHRQAGDNEVERYGMSLNDILNQIRTNKVQPSTRAVLAGTKTQHVDGERTRLYTHNLNVDTINQSELDAIETEAHTYQAYSSGDETLITQLKKNVRAPETLVLKQGAKVMFVKNDPIKEVYNGSMGVVVGFNKSNEHNILPIVRLNDGRNLTVTNEMWEIDNHQGKVLASYHQLPLCLAWAITVHKSQGMTLDAAEIDLSRTFESGQGYVALSRLKSLMGLKLLGINDKSLILDEFARVADERFLELSTQSQAWLDQMSTDALERLQRTFIKRNGDYSLVQSDDDSDDDAQDDAQDEVRYSSNGGFLEVFAAEMMADLYSSETTVTKSTKADDAWHSHSPHADALLDLLDKKSTLKDISSARKLSIASTIDEIALLIDQDKLEPSRLDYLYDRNDLDTLINVLTGVYGLVIDTKQDASQARQEHVPTDQARNQQLSINALYDELRGQIPRNDIRLMLVRLGVALC